MKRRLISCIFVALILITSMSLNAAPYSNYTFNYQGEYLYEPQAMIPEDYYDWSKMIKGTKFEKSEKSKTLNQPQDLLVDPNGYMFISDTGNNRVIFVNDKIKLVAILESFDYKQYNKDTKKTTVIKDSKFSGPVGLSLDKHGNLYVCDSENRRIVRFKYDKKGNFLCDKIYDKPNIPEFVIFRVTEIPVGASTTAPESTSTPEPTATETITPVPSATSTVSPTASQLTKPRATPMVALSFSKDDKVAKADEYYKPIRIVIDKTDRIYVVSEGLNKGIIELTNDGKFSQFIAAAIVSSSLTDQFMRKYIWSEEQLKYVVQNEPPEYNNINIDSEGFIYGTFAGIHYTTIAQHINSGKNATEAGALVRRVNAAGEDILRRKGNFPPAGDIVISKEAETEQMSDMNIYSTLVDVAIYKSGVYSALDKKRNKVFTYDTDGNLLFVYGTTGSVLGAFGGQAQSVTAISILPDNKRTAILDAQVGQITIFKPTRYAEIILDANRLQSDYRYEEANKKWNELLSISSNSEIAYIGKGSYEFQNKNYKEAMKYYQLGNDKESYSKALKEYRNGILKDVLPVVLYIGSGLFVIWFVYRTVKKVRNLGKGVK